MLLVGVKDTITARGQLRLALDRVGSGYHLLHLTNESTRGVLVYYCTDGLRLVWIFRRMYMGNTVEPQAFWTLMWYLN